MNYLRNKFMRELKCQKCGNESFKVILSPEVDEAWVLAKFVCSNCGWEYLFYE
ncbi:MAG: 50S ribosomal protein L33 [Petrotogales bacterium]